MSPSDSELTFFFTGTFPAWTWCLLQVMLLMPLLTACGKKKGKGGKGKKKKKKGHGDKKKKKKTKGGKKHKGKTKPAVPGAPAAPGLFSNRETEKQREAEARAKAMAEYRQRYGPQNPDLTLLEVHTAREKSPEPEAPRPPVLVPAKEKEPASEKDKAEPPAEVEEDKEKTLATPVMKTPAEPKEVKQPPTSPAKSSPDLKKGEGDEIPVKKTKKKKKPKKEAQVPSDPSTSSSQNTDDEFDFDACPDLTPEAFKQAEKIIESSDPWRAAMNA